jgi:hypothetical protein
MKFTPIPMLMAVMLMSSIDSSASATPPYSLAQKWNLEDPAFNYTDKTFQLTYLFSDFITNDAQTKPTLYLFDCKDESKVKDNKYEGVALALKTANGEISASNANNYTKNQQELVEVELKPAELVKATESDIFDDSDPDSATVTFCLRFSLCTDDCANVEAGTAYEVNFLESQITLDVSLKGTFEVKGISVEPKDKIKRTANQEYKLRAFQCSGKDADTGGIPYAEDSEPSFAQGDVITVCVQPEDDALSDNIYMKQVEKFEYALVGEPTVTQKAIDIDSNPNDRGQMYGLSEIDECRGTKACVIKTILFATFYTKQGTVTGTGTATMQFGTATTDRRRKLRGAEQEQRELQADDVAGAGEFDVNFQIESDDSFQSASGASSSMTILALFGSAAAALML